MSLTRYRIGEAAGTATVTDDMMLLTAVYGIIVGIVLVFIARRLKQYWMIFLGQWSFDSEHRISFCRSDGLDLKILFDGLELKS